MGRCFSPRGCEEISGCRSKSGHDTWLFPAGDRAPGSLQGTRRPARQDDDLQHLGGIILVLRCNFLLGGGVPCSWILYTSDAADELLCVDLGGRRNIKKKKT